MERLLGEYWWFITLGVVMLAFLAFRLHQARSRSQQPSSSESLGADGRPRPRLIRGFWFHVAVIVVLLSIQFFLRDIFGVYYRLVQRPRIAAAGGRSCVGYVSPLPDDTLDDCDMVVATRSDGVLNEHFYSRRGDVEKVVRSVNGKFVNGESSYRGNVRALAIPFIGFCLGFAATIRKMLRTRALLSWQLSRHESDETERLLYLYSFPLFLSGIVFPAFHS